MSPDIYVLLLDSRDLSSEPLLFHSLNHVLLATLIMKNNLRTFYYILFAGGSACIGHTTLNKKYSIEYIFFMKEVNHKLELGLGKGEGVLVWLKPMDSFGMWWKSNEIICLHWIIILLYKSTETILWL